MSEPGHWFEREPLWFKTAVFYEIHLRGFFDGNDDGSGDFRGLTDKLDYLQEIGIDCIWLLPCFPSPLRDGGYDIADFFAIHPDYGTLDDFRLFIDQAHQRGMRVIVDLVMNHTSSDHPWFQESRSDPTGPYGDWYVWGDDDKRWSEARIIFIDTEPSNWTWDPVRGQYYWHRFFSHQPDLNYDNPEVQEQMLNVLRFWLDLGLDGFRLDAVPYLYERDGTNGENLPETHAFLKRVRAEVDAQLRRPGAARRGEPVARRRRRVLRRRRRVPHGVPLPGDAAHVHGASGARTRCRSSRSSSSTPPIPDNAQWGLFLRNHDELTLEMVTDEERDYMYAEYAKDPRMKLNLGIRRRLAPLLDNGRDEIELMHAMLFSLPGSPVLYYGDEIGMGDNIFLGDRDGVRTPMQWTGDRNGGFSRADFAQLYLPPLMDPVYGYQAVNVEAQLRQPQLAAALAAPADRPAQAAPGLRARHVRGAAAREPADLRPRPDVRGRHRPLRAQSRALGAGRRARPLALGGTDPGGDVRADGLSADRRAAVSADARRSRVLLVPVAEGRGDVSETGSHRLRHEPALVRLEDARRRRMRRSSTVRPCVPPIRRSSSSSSRSASTPERTRRTSCSPATALDALADAGQARELVRLMRSGAKIEAGEGTVEFAPVDGTRRARARASRGPADRRPSSRTPRSSSTRS